MSFPREVLVVRLPSRDPDYQKEVDHSSLLFSCTSLKFPATGSIQQVGPYTLYGMTEDQGLLMWTLLDNLYRALQPVIEDVNKIKPDGTPNPSPAFTTFFKDADNMSFVAALLSNVTTGASVVPPANPPTSWQWITPSGSPVFVSLTQRNQFKLGDRAGQIDAFDLCKDSRVAFTADMTPPFPFIFICPFFWNGPVTEIAGDLPPPSVNGRPAPNCPRVNSAKTKFEPTHTATNQLGFQVASQTLGQELVEYRMWYLLEELAHHYAYVALGHTVDHYDINAAMLLPARFALENGPSYSYYAACKSFTFRSSI